MKYKSETVDNVLVLSFEGDIIGENNSLEVLEVVNEALMKNTTSCALDISNVRYINSSGIGMLITIHTKFKNKGGEVCLVNPSDHVQKLFIITKLNTIFTIVKSRSEAMERLK
jgi:anti-sigma B factor antagonist